LNDLLCKNPNIEPDDAVFVMVAWNIFRPYKITQKDIEERIRSMHVQDNFLPFSGKLNLHLTPELQEAAISTAATQGKSLNKFIIEAIKEQVN
jgi:predicted HicB family RNase H-like nuclease